MDKTLEIGQANQYSKYYQDHYNAGGNPKGFDTEKMFLDPQSNIEDIASLAKYYYHKSGMIMRTVNIMRDFGIGQVKVNYRENSKKTKACIDEFNERVDIDQVARDMLFELALTGNCAGYNHEGQRIDIYPVSVIQVSPLVVNNEPVLLYKTESDGGSFDADIDEDTQRKLKQALPKEARNSNKNYVKLNPENTFFIKVNSSRYEPYGVPFLLPAFSELAHKTLLKEAEKSTATAIVDKILMIQVGNKDYQPTAEMINFVESLFKDKKGSLRATLPYYVDAKWVEPDTQTLSSEKFDQVDKDLLSSLGVSLTLIRGEGGGNYSEGLISVAGLIKNIEALRADIPRVINRWYAQELERHGIRYKAPPTVELPRVMISSQERLRLAQWLFQNAGLPYKVLLEESGYDYDVVKLIREEENSNKAEDVFALREQPFQGSKNNGRPEIPLNERKSNPEQSNNDQPRTEE